MKNWVKAILVTCVSFIGLVGLSMLIAYGIISTHGESVNMHSNEPSVGLNHIPKAHHEKSGLEAKLNEEAHSLPSEEDFSPKTQPTPSTPEITNPIPPKETGKKNVYDLGDND